LNLPTRKLSLAFQGLIAVGTVEFEFVGAHGFCLNKRNQLGESMPKLFPILFADRLRLIW